MCIFNEAYSMYIKLFDILCAEIFYRNFGQVFAIHVFLSIEAVQIVTWQLVVTLISSLAFLSTQ